jgi:hypothetical protein
MEADCVVMTNQLRFFSKKRDLFNRTVAAISIGAMAIVNTLVCIVKSAYWFK